MRPSVILSHAAHRPWPLPNKPWIMKQVWNDLLFMHWPLPAADISHRIPAPLQLDTFDGRAWLAITPFKLTGLRARGLPPIPGPSNFPELNVRTYVVYGERPGVFFFSLDAGSLAAVIGARLGYALHYYFAHISTSIVDGSICYSLLRNRYGQQTIFKASYQPVSAVRHATPGSFEHWATERYCLYAVPRTRVYRAEIHHWPWPLQDGEARIEKNTMTVQLGIALPPVSPVCHFARRLEVLVWPPESVA